MEDRNLGFGIERLHPSEQFVQHYPERKNVRAQVDWVSLNSLGRHVGNLPLEGPDLGLGTDARGLGDAKVDHLHRAVAREENVLRADVAMNQVQRRAGLRIAELVGVSKALTRHGNDFHAQGDGEHGPLLDRPPQEKAQVRAIDVLHRDVIGTPELTKVINLDDVGVIELRSNFCFGEKKLDELLILDRKSTRLNSSHSSISYAVF